MHAKKLIKSLAERAGKSLTVLLLTFTVIAILAGTLISAIPNYR